jgi:hypothetical protein
MPTLLVVLAVIVALTVTSASEQTQPSSGGAAPSFSKWSSICEGVERTAAVALGDLDGDGDLDVVFGNGRHFAETNWVYSNDGFGGLYAKRAAGTLADPTYGVALGDLDGDGVLDVVVANDMGVPSLVYRNDGKGNFLRMAALGSFPQWAEHARRAVALGDLDGDGDLDIVLVGVGQNHVYLNEARGTRWSERPLGAAQGGDARATGVAIGDLDGDGDLDVVVPGRSKAASFVYLNDGRAGFAESRVFGSDADDMTGVALGDLDDDGDLDIVAVSWDQSHAVHENDGRGMFVLKATFGRGQEQTWSVALADMDLDGDLDVVVGNANIGYWHEDLTGNGAPDRFGNERRDAPSRIYLNDGSGTLAPGPTFGTGTDDTRPIALGDMDEDGDIDIVIGNDCQPNHVFFNSIRATPKSPVP